MYHKYYEMYFSLLCKLVEIEMKWNIPEMYLYAPPIVCNLPLLFCTLKIWEHNPKWVKVFEIKSKVSFTFPKSTTKM